MKKPVLLLIACLAAVQGAFAWDFLWREGGANLATRSPDPFERMDREYRLEALPSSWVYAGDAWLTYVEYADEIWICRDGTIVPETPRPKTISKLALLLVLRELDKLDAFFSWLDVSGLRVYWDAAQIMTTDHPIFEQGFASIKAALEITDEQAEQIMERIAK